MFLFFGVIYGFMVIMLEEDTNVDGRVGVGVKQASTREKKLTGERFGKFTESRSEISPYQSQGSRRAD